MNLRPLRGWLVRLVGLFNCKRREREFAEELESHLGLHIEDNIRAGMSPEEARRRAIIKLGGVTLNKELYREQRGLPMLETLFHDLRYGARMLMKQKSVTVIGALSLALGIGANTALFSVVDAVLLKTLPVKEPERLALFEWRAGRFFRTSGIGGRATKQLRYFVTKSLPGCARRRPRRTARSAISLPSLRSVN